MIKDGHKENQEKTGRKYGRKASAEVAKAMRERKRGTLRSGRSRKKVNSRKQAIAMGLAQAGRAGGKGTAKGIVGTINEETPDLTLPVVSLVAYR
jgi:hypothetical protein